MKNAGAFRDGHDEAGSFHQPSRFVKRRSRVFDDDELLVRAPAVLKSQGPENWSRGIPGLLWARANSRSVRGVSFSKKNGKGRAGKTVACAGQWGFVYDSKKARNGRERLALRSGCAICRHTFSVMMIKNGT